MGTRTWRVGFILIFLAGIGGELSTAQAVLTNANWLGGAGNYSGATNWSSDAVPNNSPNNWIVNITPASSTVTDDVSVTINALNISTGNKLLIQNSIQLTVDNGLGTSTITNQGSILVNSGASETYLLVGNNTILAGGGSISLGTNGNGYIYGNTSTNILINVNNTINGAGYLGNDNMGLVNYGTVNANVAGQVLQIRPNSTGTIINTNVLEATGGGYLQLYLGNFTNTLGKIAASNTSTVELNSATIVGGVISNSPTGVIIADNGSSLINPTLVGTLNNLNGSTLSLTGVISNNGTILNQAAGSATLLQIVGGSVLTGGGVINLGTNANAYLYSSVSTNILTNLNNTIIGAGNLCYDNLSLVNDGTVNANVAGQVMQVRPNSGGFIINNGLMEATGGGYLLIYYGAFTNTLGTIFASNSTTVELNNATIIGGVISNSPTGVLIADSGSSLINPTLVGTLNNLNGNTLSLTGVISNNGTILNQAAGSTTLLQIANGSVLTGGGVINLGTNANAYLYGSASTNILINLNNTIIGAGNLCYDNLSLVNDGTVNANVAGQVMQVRPNSGGFVINNSLMEATGGGYLLLYYGVFTNTLGTIFASNSTTVEVNNSTIIGGVISNSPTGVLIADNGASLVNLTLAGTLINSNANALYLTGVINNNGSIVNQTAGGSTGIQIANDTVLTGGGVVNLGTNANGYIEGTLSLNVLSNLNNTIIGAGQLCADGMILVNNGTVNANVPGQVMQVRPTGGSFMINNSLMEATGNGYLQFYYASVSNTLGTIFASNSTTVEVNNSTIIGGILTNSATGVLIADNSASLVNLSVAGTLNNVNGNVLYLTGVINNNGAIINQAAGSTGIQIANGTVLSGGGVINLGTNASGYLEGVSSTYILTNLSDTISGAGQLCNNGMGLVNDGTIDANVAGQTLVFRPSGGLIVTNYGTMRASNGGILDMIYGTFFNAGTIEARTNSTVEFDSTDVLQNYYSPGTLSGGVWRVLGTSSNTVLDIYSGNPITNNLASIELGGPGVTFSEITTLVTNQGTFKLSGGNKFVTITNLVNSGTVIVTDPGSSLSVTSFLANTGTVLVSNSATLAVNVAWTNSGVVNLQGGVVSGAAVTDTGLMEGNGTINPNLTDQGTVVASSGTLDIVGALIVGNSSGTTGAVWVTGGDLALGSSVTTLGGSGVGSMVVSSGVVSANALAVGSQAGSHGALVIAGGVVAVTSNITAGVSSSAAGTIQITGGTLYVTNANTTASLVVGELGNGSYTQSVATVTVNRLLVTNSASLIAFNSGTLVSAGTIVSNGQLFAIGDGIDPATYQLEGGVHSFAKNLEVRDNGTLTGCGTVTGNVLVDVSATVLINCGGTLTFGGIVTNNGTMRAINGSTLEAYGTVVNNGTIDIIDGGATNFHAGIINLGTILTAAKVEVSQIIQTGQNVVVHIQSYTGHTYQLQYTPSLQPTNWTSIGTSQAGSGAVLTFTDTGGASTSQRFYRVDCTAP